MNNMKKLDELFELWERKWQKEGRDRNVYDVEKYVKDGIVDKDTWDKTEKKILFILKEPNGEQDKDDDGNMNLAFGLRKDVKKLNQYATWRNIFLWSQGLLNTDINNITDFNKIHKRIESGNLKNIAILNLKKTYGTSVSDMSEIKDFANKDKDLILKEIELINPDIIVTANVMYILKMLIPKEQLNTNLNLDKYNDWINEWNVGHKSICIIKHYHPQCWNFKDETKYNDCCLSYQQYLVKNNNSRI
ncbi:uncharacterized protein YihD (DUF1040 family) [Clostridium beijerinckii]|uniref:hypothetical protein n=1 Tax=Clostridium beijerinckii TaxID=1520 RepID=UPI001494C494|nr:hypothetical protein [Clostridium beijerinckii]NOW90687.1 uncharacterized protein YihD (DUF1040 family) [Clostridium beijerinckii]